MDVNEAQRLRQMEDENRRLKQLVADLSLDAVCSDVRSTSAPTDEPSSVELPLAATAASLVEKTTRPDLGGTMRTFASASPELLERCCAPAEVKPGSARLGGEEVRE